MKLTEVFSFFSNKIFTLKNIIKKRDAYYFCDRHYTFKRILFSVWISGGGDCTSTWGTANSAGHTDQYVFPFWILYRRACFCFPLFCGGGGFSAYPSAVSLFTLPPCFVYGRRAAHTDGKLSDWTWERFLERKKTETGDLHSESPGFLQLETRQS